MTSGLDSEKIRCHAWKGCGEKTRSQHREGTSVLSVAVLQASGRPSSGGCTIHLRRSDPGSCALSPWKNSHTLMDSRAQVAQNPGTVLAGTAFLKPWGSVKPATFAKSLVVAPLMTETDFPPAQPDKGPGSYLNLI